MSNFFRDTEVRKAAKDHRCTYCGETIPKGELYKEQSGVWDGRAFRNKFHAECFDALCEEGEEEFMPYSNERPGADTRAAAAIGGQT